MKRLGLRKETLPSSLDYHCSIWVEEEELGNYKTIIHRKREVTFKVPEIDKKLILRLKGLGKTKRGVTGNLLIHIRLNKGEDGNAYLWLSESSARNGITKNLLFMQRRIQVLIPKGSSNGSVIKIEGEGKEPQSDGDRPPHRGKRGNLFVNLRTYPDYIKPVYRSFESLDTDAMALEGWVYRKKDEVTSRLGYSILGIQPVDADTIADIFNEKGWEAVFHYLVNHLGLARLLIELETSDFTSTPGKCQQYVLSSNSGTFRNYKIWLSKAFLDNPFCVAAILAHELCHVVYREKFENLPPQSQSNSSKQTLEEERMVDLLVFMFKLGGFQIRVSRGSRITMGYFNQETFDRIYVILLKESEKTKRENRT